MVHFTAALVETNETDGQHITFIIIERFEKLTCLRQLSVNANFTLLFNNMDIFRLTRDINSFYDVCAISAHLKTSFLFRCFRFAYIFFLFTAVINVYIETV